MPTALAISPHLDDAVFSAAVAITRLRDAGWRVAVATVFTRSVPDPTGFALACQLDKGVAPEVDYMALRRAEDAAALQVLGLEPPMWLDLPEAPHRGYGSAPALFGPFVPEDDAQAAVDAAVRTTVEAVSPDLVLAPQSVGAHVDHRHVTAAVQALAVPTAWWEDHPYAGRPDAVRPFAFGTGDELRPTSEEARLKAAACAAYATQIGFQFGSSERLQEACGRAEAVLCAAGPELTGLFEPR